MASSINASTTAGLVNTADTSGVLQLQTAGVTAISIDASQAVTFAGPISATGVVSGTNFSGPTGGFSVGSAADSYQTGIQIYGASGGYSVFTLANNTTVTTVTPTGLAVTGALSATGNVTLGDASTDTLNVGNGGLIKDASGNLLVGTTAPVYNAAGRGLITINGSSAAALGFTTGAVDKGIILHTGTDMIMSNSVSGAITFQTNNTERARIDTSGQMQFTTTQGVAQISNTISASFANGATLDFTNFSGMIIVSNWSTGNVGVFITGGGASALVSSIGAGYGTVTYPGTFDGYRWTNTTGSTYTFSFTAIRYRPNA